MDCDMFMIMTKYDCDMALYTTSVGKKLHFTVIYKVVFLMTIYYLIF